MSQKVFTVTVSKCTGLYEIPKEKTVKIYPNPGPGMFYIECTETINISVNDPLGRLILETKLENGKQEVDLKNFEDGIYLIRTRGKEQAENFKVVKTE